VVLDAGAGRERRGVCGMRCEHRGTGAMSRRGTRTGRLDAVPGQTVPRVGGQAVFEITTDFCKENGARDSNSSPRC
jgi:hypothetical protein